MLVLKLLPSCIEKNVKSPSTWAAGSPCYLETGALSASTVEKVIYKATGTWKHHSYKTCTIIQAVSPTAELYCFKLQDPLLMEVHWIPHSLGAIIPVYPILWLFTLQRLEEGEGKAQPTAFQIQGSRGGIVTVLLSKDTYANLGGEDPPRQNSLEKAGLYKNADLFSRNCFVKR